MTIKEYIEHMRNAGENVSLSSIAREIPCAPAYISMIANEKANPSYKMAARIEIVTNGLVKITNWYSSENSSNPLT